MRVMQWQRSRFESVRACVLLYHGNQYCAGVPDEFAAYPTDLGLHHEEVWLNSADGVKLYCWHVWPPSTAPGSKLPVVIFFQENAGNMSFRLPFIALLIKHLRCAVFVLGYRGYGKSEGMPKWRCIVRSNCTMTMTA